MTENPRPTPPPVVPPPVKKRRFEQVITITYAADDVTNALGVPWWIVFADACRSLAENHAIFVADANPHIEDIKVMSEFREVQDGVSQPPPESS